MTNLNQLDMTVEMAGKLARGFKTGIKNKRQVTDILTEATTLWINKKDVKSGNFIRAFWEALNGDAPSIAVARSLLNRISKRINKENGNPDAPALTVKDGEIVDVVPRSSKGGEGGEGSEIGKDAPQSPKVKEISENVRILSEHLRTVKDVAVRSALKQAIAELAAKI
jgi:hypothetical protein